MEAEGECLCYTRDLVTAEFSKGRGHTSKAVRSTTTSVQRAVYMQHVHAHTHTRTRAHAHTHKRSHTYTDVHTKRAMAAEEWRGRWVGSTRQPDVAGELTIRARAAAAWVAAA